MKKFASSSSSMQRSPGARLFVVIGIVIFLLFPMFFIMDLISEREYRRQEVAGEISDKWGLPQTLTGPVLSLPYRVTALLQEKNDDGNVVEKTKTLTRQATVLPQQVSITGDVRAETLRRSIFETVVYVADLTVEGVFTPPDFAELTTNGEFASAVWEDAVFSLGLSDMRGIDQEVAVSWAGAALNVEPGPVATASIYSALNARPPMSPQQKEYPFSLHLTLKGSGGLFFTPAGRTTRVQLHSNWPAPSFDGAFLPDEREVTGNGFAASWEVLHLNRNYPQQWTGENTALNEAHFGVRLLQPVSQYQETMRTAKYAILFIILTYTSVFLTELLTRRTLHPIQYLLVGLGLAAFYLLELSISEHLNFDAAYGLAAAAVIGLIGGYVRAILGAAQPAAVITAILAFMYGFFYVLLQLEDYALLVGSLGLFAILAVIMYLTRRVNWWNAFAGGNESTEAKAQQD